MKKKSNKKKETLKVSKDFKVSAKTMKQIDQSISNIKKGVVYGPVKL